FMSKYYLTPDNTPEISGLLWPNPKQIETFTMTDQNDNEFGIDNLRGKWSFVFFGYTNCPDVCPITMSVLKQVNEQLIASGIPEVFQIIFVSVDPQRDSVTKLNEYINFFNPEFIGLGGDIEQLESLTGQIGIAYMYGLPEEDGEYLVDHTSSIFLLDPQARLVSILSPPHQSDSIVGRFQEITRFINNNTP
ncbi:MAG: SCO family protein, partial [Gammaproteobacteria bacterium]|nr:SCO family protein [Gammaproteobacteria bacterium]